VYKRQGEKRTVVECQVDDVGPALRYATAKVTKVSRGTGGGGFGGGPADDPWSSPAPAGDAGWGSAAGSASDEPPF
jgi:single-strand DNA-binding protein